MRRNNRAARLTVLVFAAVGGSACTGQTLSFGGGGVAAASLPPGTIASLSDEQDLQVCDWLYASFPMQDHGAAGAANLSLSPGYENGPAFGDPGTTGQAPLLWVALPPSDCVKNLRHSACAGTTAALKSCVGFFVSHFTAGFSYADGVAACTGFVDAPACDETVFQHSLGAQGDPTCEQQLPVESGATCPPPGATDAGAD